MIVDTEALMERIRRWADNLPERDAIPINESEKFPLACRLAGENNPKLASSLIDEMNHGSLRFRGHRIIVLSDK